MRDDRAACRRASRCAIAASAALALLAGCDSAGGGGGGGGDGRSQSPGPAAVPTYLVYVSSDDVFAPHAADADLYAFEPGARRRVRLNPERPGGQIVRAFQIAPDRSRIAFVATDRATGRLEVYTVRPDGTGAVQVSPDLESGGSLNPFSLAWSPDSTRLAYLADLRGDSGTDLLVVDADGSNHLSLTHNPLEDVRPGSVMWSPASTHIAYRQGGGGADLYVIEAGGGNRVSLARSQSLASLQDATTVRWAPDNSRLLYRTDKEAADRFELYSVAPDGSAHVKLNGALVDGGDVFADGLAWTPDSAKIVYAANQTEVEAIDLYSVNADGSAATRLNGAVFVPPSATPASRGVMPRTVQVSPDGSHVAYLVEPTERNLFAVRLDGTGEVELSATSGFSLRGVGRTSVAWSATGARLVYVANEFAEAIDDLFSVAADGSGKIRLSAASARARAVPPESVHWSPDGSTVTWLDDLSVGGLFDLYVAGADGSGRTVLNAPPGAQARIDEQSIQWSPDGSRVLFVADRNGDGVEELFTVAPDVPGEIRVSRDLPAGGQLVGDTLHWSPDGEWIAYRADHDMAGVFELFLARRDGSENLKANGDLAPGQRIEGSFRWGP